MRRDQQLCHVAVAMALSALTIAGASQEQKVVRTILGSVVDPSGAPITDAVVSLSAGELHPEEAIVTVATDSGGRFHLKTERIGKHTVVARAKGWFSVSVEVNVTPGNREFNVGTVRLAGPACSSPDVICDDFGISEELRGPTTLSVCDVTRDPLRFGGRTIAVRGLIRHREDELWLVGKDCKTSLKTNLGFAWANTLWIVQPTTASAAMSSRPGDIDDSLEHAALQRIQAEIRRRRSETTAVELWVTFVGRVETRANISSAVSVGSDGKPRFDGYGVAGLAPAQLIIRSAKDLIVLSVP